jgi:hypothetical protein
MTHPLPDTRLDEIKSWLDQKFPGDRVPDQLSKGRSLH